MKAFGGNMKIRFLATAWLACMAVVPLTSIPAHAQFRTSIQGTVTDPEGAVVPGAQVTLKDNANGAVMNATSGANGAYSFNALPPDQFTLTATAKGFQQAVINNLTVIPEQPNGVDIKLALGSETTTITVSGETAPVLDT